VWIIKWATQRHDIRKATADVGAVNTATALAAAFFLASTPTSILDPHQKPGNPTAPGGYVSSGKPEGEAKLVNPWRIFMALRSGRLTECTWALLFEDSTLQFFGISNLPGLLTLLLEPFLAQMFKKRKNEEQSALLAEDADDNSFSSYNRSRHYEDMESSCYAEDTDRIDEAGSE